ncbi:hypothetical protein D9619_011962 [Psilocybe cf. subviscida]|uniref:Uncharacterized protein n=1 Tax=Psilocybe cf. subviscida TaxID=2480587 RepID=A0A8H5B0J8_9AGAR|nr:hypothetical protein D9619_011962 [Psilocybe cf. subviscida]
MHEEVLTPLLHTQGPYRPPPTLSCDPGSLLAWNAADLTNEETVITSRRRLFNSPRHIDSGLTKPGNDPTHRTNISLENVANQSVHLHLHNTYKYLAPGERTNSEPTTPYNSDNEEEDEEYGTDEEYANLGATLSKMLSKTKNKRAFHQAANDVAKTSFTDEKINPELEHKSSTRINHTFMGCSDSRWNTAVQGVVDSVKGISKCATDLFHAPSATQTSPDEKRCLGVVDASLHALEPEPGPAARTATLADPIPSLEERMMTIHPLLLPPGGKPNVTAHHLASLYFEAILNPWDIPEFRAEYIYTGGRCTSILLDIKNVHHADRLKEMWDSTDRESTPVPELAHISLYQGNTFSKRADTSVRNAAFEELASYSLCLAPFSDY